MELQVIQFRAAHIPIINPNASTELLDAALLMEMESNEDESTTPTVVCRAATLCLGSVPIACAGVRIVSHRVGEAWAIFSPLSKRFPVGLFKAVSSGLEKIIADLRSEMDRLIALVDPKDEAAQRFMEHLGFPKEERKFLYKREINPWTIF